MGYDSNIKSGRAERRKRIIIVIFLTVLSVGCLILVGVLRPAIIGGGVAPAPSSAIGGNSLSDARLTAAKVHAEVNSATEGSQSADLHPVNPNLRRSGKQGSDASLASEENLVAERLATLTERHAKLEAKVRAIKRTGVIMEADEHSLEMTGKLQDATRELLKLQYGDFGSKTYRVQMDLEFQPTIPDFAVKGKDGTLLIELAPISLIPCSVYNFLEIARTWKSGAFHRNAGHVLQAMTHSDVKQSMPFQEYNEEYPHKKGTIGYAGRPSGPEFYLSIEDNTSNHGPGSQQNKNPHEADSIIGKIIGGGMNNVVPRIHKMPGHEFIGDKKKWVLIRRMHILVPGDGPGSVDGYVHFSKSPLVIEQ